MGSRMFAAVYPPADVVEEMEEFFGPRRDADARLRWVPDHHWHLTTLFCGDVPDRAYEPLVENLREVAAAARPFDVRLAGAGAFPDPIETRQLYLAVVEGGDQLAALSRGCRAAASRAGTEPDGTKFVPHLTLARTKPRFDSTSWLRVIDAFPGVRFAARELVVVESFTNEGRGNRVRHETVARLPFGRGEDRWWDVLDGSTA
ncbi:RNA 2',3'-cyclic phosphodiesterase [Mariniluteicoccus flavus]